MQGLPKRLTDSVADTPGVTSVLVRVGAVTQALVAAADRLFRFPVFDAHLVTVDFPGPTILPVLLVVERGDTVVAETLNPFARTPVLEAFARMRRFDLRAAEHLRDGTCG